MQKVGARSQNKRRDENNPQIDKFGKTHFKLYRGIDDLVDDYEFETGQSTYADYDTGHHYREHALTESDTAPVIDTDLGHLHEIEIRGITDEILEPGKFLKRAIEQMYNFGLENNAMHWPSHWLSFRGFQGRYVSPEILKERQVLPELEVLTDTIPCTWSEHKRAQLMMEHEEYVSFNINEFVDNGGMDEKCVSLANELESKYQAECYHLPILWSVLNIRQPRSSTILKQIFMHRVNQYNSNNNDELLEAMIMLIQSRYLIEVAEYHPDGLRLSLPKNGGIWRRSFEQWELENLPLAVFVRNTGDVYIFQELEGPVMSFYKSYQSIKLGNQIAEALRLMCPWLPERIGETVQVTHGLVTINESTNDLRYYDTSIVATPLALEMMLHAFVDIHETASATPIDHDVYTGELSRRLTEMNTKCMLIPKLHDVCWARRWWAITRSELGNQTDAMNKFNAHRGLGDNVVRSAWDYKERWRISNEDDVKMEDVLKLLSDFSDNDVVTFSGNNLIVKYNLSSHIKDPICDGISSEVSNARVDFMNKSYSDNGGPRLYTQRELNFMMTNPSARELRRKLTLRLYYEKPVFFLLGYDVSDKAMELNQEAESHAALCKVTLSAPSRNKRDGSMKREIVVEWLEGVFENIYKLCAVPTLTYLSMYFGVDVRQIEFSHKKTLRIQSKKPSCVVKALYAANERMRTIFESHETSDWNSYVLTEEEADEYTRKLMYSLILISREPESNIRQHFKRSRKTKWKYSDPGKPAKPKVEN